MVVAPVLGTVVSKHSKAVEVIAETQEEQREFLTTHATVKILMGTTRNLGNFESFRVDVSLEVPCIVGEEDDTFENAYAWVEAKLGKVLNDVEES